jgi:hypothetical protein
VVILLARKEHFNCSPEHTEHEEDTYVGSEVSQRLEDRHKEQTAHTEAEHDVAFLL